MTKALIERVKAKKPRIQTLTKKIKGSSTTPKGHSKSWNRGWGKYGKP